MKSFLSFTNHYRIDYCGFFSIHILFSELSKMNRVNLYLKAREVHSTRLSNERISIYRSQCYRICLFIPEPEWSFILPSKQSWNACHQFLFIIVSSSHILTQCICHPNNWSYTLKDKLNQKERSFTNYLTMTDCFGSQVAFFCFWKWKQGKKNTFVSSHFACSFNFWRCALAFCVNEQE